MPDELTLPTDELISDPTPAESMPRPLDLAAFQHLMVQRDVAKLHLGGYFDARDATIMTFQKLRVELRRSQQDMLLEAISDFVAKYQAATAFKE